MRVNVPLFLAGLATGVVCGSLVAAGKRPLPPPRCDWRNPDFAPPGFTGVKPHAYRPDESLPCCVECGGGKLHAVHVQGIEDYVEPRSDHPRDVIERFISASEEIPGFVRPGADRPLREQ